jgi:hypothetical protein
MPTVPSYSPQVSNAPLRGGENTTRAIPTAAGSTAGAIGGALTGLGEVGDRIQQRRDLDEAFRVETKVLSDYSEFEQNLRKTRRGAAAKDVVNDVDKWWSKLDETYGADVSPQVKQLTMKSLARARAQSLESTGRYQMAEEDRAQTQSFIAVNGQEIQRALTDGKPEVIASAKGKIDAAVNAFGATRGWSADELAAEKLKWSNMLHTQAVEQMVNSKPEAARAYFEANRKEIDVANHKRLDDIIEHKVTDQAATDNAAKWATLPFEQAMANAGEITNPEERKKTIAAVKELQSEKNIANSLREKEASDKVWQMVASGVPLNRLPAATLAQMDGKERVQVNNYFTAERARREAEAKGHEVKTDPKVYGEVLAALRRDPVGTKPAAYSNLSRGDILALQKHQDAILRGKEGKAPEVASTEQQMGPYIRTMGLKDEKKGAFQKAAYDEFEAYRATTGKEPDYEERKKILDRLSLPGEVLYGSFFKADPNMRYFEAAPEQRGKFAPDIPPADREGLAAAFTKRNNRAPTEAELITAFRKLKGIQ